MSHASVDTRNRLKAELDKPDLSQDTRTELLKSLALVEVECFKYWHARNKKQRAKERELAKQQGPKKPSKNKGRAKRLYDSHGEPLYQGVPALIVPEDETTKFKFLSTLKEENYE